MIDLVTLKENLYSFVNGLTGVSCVWANQNGIVPNDPFIRLTLSDFNVIGQPLTRIPENQTQAGEVEVSILHQCNLEIQCFGPGAIETLLNFRSSLAIPETYQELTENNIVPIDFSNSIIDISGIENDQNSERGSFEIVIRFTETISDSAQGSIEVVESEMTLENFNKPLIERDILVDSTIIQ